MHAIGTDEHHSLHGCCQRSIFSIFATLAYLIAVIFASQPYCRISHSTTVCNTTGLVKHSGSDKLNNDYGVANTIIGEHYSISDNKNYKIILLRLPVEGAHTVQDHVPNRRESLPSSFRH